MSSNWPPIDAHTHIATGVMPDELLALRAVLFAATRSLSEFRSVAGRSDPLAVWGVGLHPGLKASYAKYDRGTFEQLLQRSPLVSEIGLDGRSQIPLEHQKNVLVEILELLSTTPRIVSMHSAFATGPLLEVLASCGARPGIILHWWRGTPAETRAALELGCWFSINEHEIAPEAGVVLQNAPPDRVLLETDHPHGNRTKSPARPGGLVGLEHRLAKRWSVSPREVREGLWGNLARLVKETQTLPMFPETLRRMLIVAPPPMNDAGRKLPLETPW